MVYFSTKPKPTQKKIKTQTKSDSGQEQISRPKMTKEQRNWILVQNKVNWPKGTNEKLSIKKVAR